MESIKIDIKVKHVVKLGAENLDQENAAKLKGKVEVLIEVSENA